MIPVRKGKKRRCRPSPSSARRVEEGELKDDRRGGEEKKGMINFDMSGRRRSPISNERGKKG